MLETNENTPTRLVITLGSRYSNFARIILDKSAGTARFERRMLMLPRRAIELPLADIASVDAIVLAVYSKEYYILIRTKAGKKIWLAGDSRDASVATAKQIRDFVGLPAPAAGTDPVPRSTRRMMKIAGAVSTLAVIVFVVAQLIRWFALPDCDSSDVLDTARDLLKRNTQKAIALSNVEVGAQANSEKRCRALLTVEGSTATVGYRVYKDGLSTIVQMTGPVGTDKLPPEWLHAIKNASERFLSRADDSHLTGNPPRRSDPDIGELVDVVFDTSVLSGKTLAPSEIQGALDWFDMGDNVGTVYVVAGTGFRTAGEVPATPEMQERMQSNVVKFADEFGRYVDFQVTLLAAAAKAIASVERNSLPEDWEKSAAKEKQQEVRADLAQTMESDVISLAYAGFADDWRLARLATLEAMAPVAASFLEGEQAKAVRERALQVVEYQRTPAVQDELRKLADLVAKP